MATFTVTGVALAGVSVTTNLRNVVPVLPSVTSASETERPARTVWTTLPLAIRETAERTALVICGDPAAALSIVLAECPGGLDRPEVARLARFAVSEQYLSFGQT